MKEIPFGNRLLLVHIYWVTACLKTVNYCIINNMMVMKATNYKTCNLFIFRMHIKFTYFRFERQSPEGWGRWCSAQGKSWGAKSPEQRSLWSQPPPSLISRTWGIRTGWMSPGSQRMTNPHQSAGHVLLFQITISVFKCLDIWGTECWIGWRVHITL